MDGTTTTGGTTSESAVIARSEKPKPEKPLTTAAPKTQSMA